MSTKHTPGPWKWDEWEDNEDTPFVYVDLPVETAGENAISILFVADWGTEADARLASAAPDLLEALEEILGPLASVPMGNTGHHTEQKPQQPNLRVSAAAIFRARAAIAKARKGTT